MTGLYCWRLHPSARAAAAGATRLCDSRAKLIQSVSSSKFTFGLGSDVYIRPKSAKERSGVGRIVDIVDTSSARTSSDASAKRCKTMKAGEDVRVSMQMHCFGEGRRNTIKAGVRPSRLFPVYDINEDAGSSGETLIILTPDTTNYRLLATSHIRPYDKVLEIGCSTGECTALLVRRLLLLNTQQQRDSTNKSRWVGNNVVAFDTGSEVLEQAKRSVRSEFDRFLPDAEDMVGGKSREQFQSQMIQYHKVDALADPKGAHSKAMGDSNRTPDIILIDIGGNREFEGVVRMIDWVQMSFQGSRLIIVKSEALAAELSGALVPEEGQAGEQERTDSNTVQPRVSENGIICRGQEWFSSLPRLMSAEGNTAQCKSTGAAVQKYSHPLQAPRVLSPQDGATPICRFHNYDAIDGCKRHREGQCEFDHDNCHWCGEKGHIALHCTKRC